MAALSEGGKPDEAVAAFDSFMREHVGDRRALARIYFPALQMMLRSGDRTRAAAFAARMARETRLASWRHVATVLYLAEDPRIAVELLPRPDLAEPIDVFLGLVVSAPGAYTPSNEPWLGPLDKIQRQGEKGRAALRIRPGHRVLAELAAGRPSRARAQAESAIKSVDLDRGAVAEMLARPGPKDRIAAEAASLLKAAVAIDVGLPDVGRGWAMDVLRARPQCQWAAALAVQVRPDSMSQKEVLELLRPKDCALAQTLKASLLQLEQKHAEATRVLREAVKRDKDDMDLTMRLAMAVENAGDLENALQLYRTVWKKKKSPIAANNAAYVVSQLYPGDRDRLAESLRQMEVAVRESPDVAAFRDTKGWISFLLGIKEQAKVDVRRAIKGLRDSPEVHYHLGVIEADAGNVKLARWHLAAAVKAAEVASAGGRKLGIAERNAVKMATDALAKMDLKQK